MLLTRALASVALATMVVACSAAPPLATPTAPGPSTAPGGTGTEATPGTASPGASGEVTQTPAATGSGITFAGPSPDAPFDPVALAQAVYGADSDAERQQAIVNALAAINIGMYTAAGNPIFSGAERTATDFVVYDFEIAALSGGIADGDDHWLDDLAEQLSAMNVAGADAPFSAADFAAAVTAATASAMAAADNPNGRAVRLARELALASPKPLDLALAPASDPIVLDPLAAFLVAADYSLPRIFAAAPPAEANTAQIAAVGAVTGPIAASPCSGFTSRIGSNWYAGAVQVGSTQANASFSQLLQAELMGGTVKVGISYEHSWHHQHRQDQPALKQYFFGLQVRVQAPPSVNCGPIRYSNGQVQGGGQVVGADVSWTHPNLEHHGDITCDAKCTKTDAQGKAELSVIPKEEPGPGGIGPEVTETVRVSAEVNLMRALGQDLFSVLTLPPDMRVLARKTMPTDVTWHHGYDVRVLIDSKLYAKKVPSYDFANHFGTGKADGILDVKTVHPPGDLAFDQPAVGTLATITSAGSGPDCAPGFLTSIGSVKALAKTGSIDFQVIDAVIYPPQDVELYLDVGPADDYKDDSATLRSCDRTPKVVYTGTDNMTNFWEYMIFFEFPAPQGISLKGLGAGRWDYHATQANWDGSAEFVVARWDTAPSCGIYCDPGQSWFRVSILAKPIRDP